MAGRIRSVVRFGSDLGDTAHRWSDLLMDQHASTAALRAGELWLDLQRIWVLRLFCGSADGCVQISALFLRRREN